MSAHSFPLEIPLSLPAGFDQSTLEMECQQLLMEVPALTNRNSYAFVQNRFVGCGAQLGQLGPDGSPCREDEWTLCLFVTLRVKVHLSAVLALHIEQAFLDSLVDYLGV